MIIGYYLEGKNKKSGRRIGKLFDTREQAIAMKRNIMEQGINLLLSRGYLGKQLEDAIKEMKEAQRIIEVESDIPIGKE